MFKNRGVNTRVPLNLQYIKNLRNTPIINILIIRQLFHKPYPVWQNQRKSY
jgi:hypothetical protein